LDLAEAPQIVLEQPAPCPDSEKALELLRRALAPSVAPRKGWTLTARFSKNGGTLAVEGELTDDADAPVAHRVLAQQAHECSSLARAIGVWGSLVLDAEVERAAAARPPPTIPSAAWPAPAQKEKPAPEQALFLAHAEGHRAIELGATMFMMGGTGSGAVAGPSLFSMFEIGHGWFLRPALVLGRTIQELTPSSDVYATFGATRLDACGRIPGLYLEKHGIQLDVCGGMELGFIHFDSPSTAPQQPPEQQRLDAESGRTLPFLAVGPSVALRGELGGDLSAMVRGVAELNLIRDSFFDSTGASVDPSVFVGRAELGLSWRLR
jgi:hypothetical protein